MNSRFSALGLGAIVLGGPGSPLPAADTNPAAVAASSTWIALARGRVEPPGGILPVAAAREGMIKEILANEGDHVVQGTALATLDDEGVRLQASIVQRELAQAGGAVVTLRLRLNAARRELRRIEQLVEEQLTNAQERDIARDRVAELEAEIALATLAEETVHARLELAKHEVAARSIRAPVTGQIIRRLVKPGEVTGPQAATPLFWLAPAGLPVVRAELDEEALALVRAGQSAEVVTESSAGPAIQATVQSVGLLFGPRRPATEDPAERQDVRVVECVVTLGSAAPPLVYGQRVVVRFLRAAPSAK